MGRVRAKATGCRLAIDRRQALTALPALCAAAVAAPAAADPADERPKEGDYLVAVDNTIDNTMAVAANPDGLAPKDIAGPLIAWPMDPETRLVRNGSRLNKVLLVHLDPATLDGPTRGRAADGVVAYSAICPHAGCEVSGWIDDRKILECPCHNSKYDPREGAAIVAGPTTRGLAALPLKIVNDKLAVAKPFVGRLGIAPA